MIYHVNTRQLWMVGWQAGTEIDYDGNDIRTKPEAEKI